MSSQTFWMTKAVERTLRLLMESAGLRLAPGGNHLTRAWIMHNRPATPNYMHGGLLMGLGLIGALNRHARLDSQAAHCSDALRCLLLQRVILQN